MKKLTYISLFFLLSFPAKSFTQEQKQTPITIALNDWASQIVISYAIGDILEKQGYKIHYREITTNKQWGALRLGEIDLQLEVWEGTMAKEFNRMVEQKLIIDAGTHDAITREEWWYPAYVEKLCPGLPSWTVLNQCSNLFTMDYSGLKGVYITGPWDKQEGKRIRALKLNYLLKKIGGEAFKPTILLAIKKQTPLLIMNWTPNWVERRVEGHFIEFPPFEPECISVPKWGPNPYETMDCGNPKNGWLKKATSKHFPKKWPCAFQLIKNINFNNQMISEASALYEYDRYSYMDAAKKWLQTYKNDINQWLSAKCLL
ncbi:ABC transporter substrate-binding protein [Zooshikella sp. RANM57]|uniref:ABC transporter substrate-binding protein n=1 Tax=Zooshikella sp. RANM57 TaxID=3425863 RepID=UPI003D6DA9D8